MSTVGLITSKLRGMTADEHAQVLRYLEWLEATRPISDEDWGIAAAKAAAETLNPEDFSDWEQPKRG